MPLNCTGFYRGTVKRHLSNGLLKVFIDGVYPEEYKDNPDQLPDCEQAAPLFGGSTIGNGMFSQPNLDAKVWCFFQNNDQNYPVCFAAAQGGSSALNEYNNNRNNVTDKTVENGLDVSSHKINIKNSEIQIWDEGKIVIQAMSTNADAMSEEDKKKVDYARITLDGKGSIIIEASKQIDIKAPAIKQNADTVMEISTPVFKNENKISNTVISPSISLNARDTDQSYGSIAIIGKKHTDFNY